MRPSEAETGGARAAVWGQSPVTTSLVGKAFEFLALLLMVTLVPRLLGPSDYGLFALAVAIVTIGSASLSPGGVWLMARFIPAAAPADRATVARALSRRLARWRAAQMASLAGLAAVLVVAAPVGLDPLLTALVVAAFALDLAATLAFQAGLGLGLTTLWSFRYALQNTFLVAAAIPLHAVAGDAGAVGAVTVAAAGVLVIGAASVVPRLRRAETGAELPEGALRFAALQGVGGLLVQLTHRGGVVAVALLDGSEAQTGFAALAIGVALAAYYACAQPFLVQLPALLESRGDDLDAIAAAGRRLARDALVVLLPVACVGAVSLGAVLPIVFGEGFEGADTAFGPALAVLPIAPLAALANQMTALWLRPGVRAWTAAAGAATFVLVAALAVPAWAAAGASAALLASTVAIVLLSALIFRQALTAPLVLASLSGAALVLLLAESS
jgi:hypothetical protein